MIKHALVSLLLGCCASSAALAQADGKAAYDELCLSCHKQPQRLAARMARTDEARGKLDSFLAGHYAPDPGKRQAVIDYMYGLK
jgi:hypothetical protein